jgi:hypothetical protein
MCDSSIAPVTSEFTLRIKLVYQSRKFGFQLRIVKQRRQPAKSKVFIYPLLRRIGQTRNVEQNVVPLHIFDNSKKEAGRLIENIQAF